MARRSRQAARIAPAARWTPHPGPQTFLFQCPVREVLYGGARGGGKTAGLIHHWRRHANQYGPRAKGVLFRREYSQAAELIQELRKAIPEPEATWSGASAQQRLMHRNGAVLYVRHCKNRDDAEKTQGGSFNWMGIEEMTHWGDPVVIDLLLATLRDPTGVPCWFLATTNPGGRGHHWVRQEWVEPGRLVDPKKARYAGERRPFTARHRVSGEALLGADGRPRTRIFIPAKVSDNPSLGPEYLALLRTYSKHRQQLWIEGRWDVAPGGFLEGIWNAARHSPAPFIPPRDWLHFRAMDWGFADPCSVGWYAQRPSDQALFRYDELYTWTGIPDTGARVDPQALAGLIKQREANAVRNGVRFLRNPASPDMWGEHGTGTTVGDILWREGVRFDPAKRGPGSRISGAGVIVWALVNDKLFVTRNCEQWLRTVPGIPTSEKNVEDVDEEAEDHCWEETRYAVTSRATLRPPEPVRKGEPGYVEGRPPPTMVGLEDLARGTGIPAHFPRPDLYEMLRRR